MLPPPRSTLFPYTTLFRSERNLLGIAGTDDCITADSRFREMRKIFPHSTHGASAERLDSGQDRKSTRLNSSHPSISYAVFCLKKKTSTRLREFSPKWLPVW